METYVCDKCGSKIPIIDYDKLQIDIVKPINKEKIMYTDDEIYKFHNVQKFVPYAVYDPDIQELALYFYDFERNRKIIRHLLKKFVVDEIKNVRVVKMAMNERNKLDPNELRELYSGKLEYFLDYITNIIMTAFGDE